MTAVPESCSISDVSALLDYGSSGLAKENSNGLYTSALWETIKLLRLVTFFF